MAFQWIDLFRSGNLGKLVHALREDDPQFSAKLATEVYQSALYDDGKPMISLEAIQYKLFKMAYRLYRTSQLPQGNDGANLCREPPFEYADAFTRAFNKSFTALQETLDDEHTFKTAAGGKKGAWTTHVKEVRPTAHHR